MEKDKNIIKQEAETIVNRDGDGKIISAAFPVSERTKKDQSKTSVVYTLIAVLLHILAFIPIVAIPIVLAVKCQQLAPYYSFWHYVGVIVAVVFAIIYAVVVVCVTRKASKSNIAMQTVKIAITFTCLTSVFAMILTYAVPDIIAMATQNTLFAEDVFYNGEAQAEKNIKLDRQFIMYNVLNGNLNDHSDNENGDFTYKTLAKKHKDKNGNVVYDNSEINRMYNEYKAPYNKSTALIDAKVIDVMEKNQPRKFELYDFIYSTYVLNDFDYAMFNNVERRALALAITDYIYIHANYENLLKEGFKNKRIKHLFDVNFDSFNHDGYQPFDDPLLLYAQMDGRITVPVVLRLILNEGWSYSQGAVDNNGNLQFAEDGNFLYELFDKDARDAFVNDGGKFEYTGKLVDGNGNEYEAKYGFNKDGWMVFENGVVKRPIKWLVLDMLGDPMELAKVDIFGLLGGLLGGNNISGIINNLLPALGNIFNSVGDLLHEDVAELIKFATGGANLNINLCIDDDNQLAISIAPMNAQYGILGYMQASWVLSNNLLMAVINLLGVRNWFAIFGAVGVVIVIAAGVMRECAKKTRLRTAVSRDRIAREKTARRIADGELEPGMLDEHSALAANLTAEDIAAIEEAQRNRTDDGSVAADVVKADKKKDKKKKSLDEIDLDNIDDIDIDNLDLDGIDLNDIDLDEESGDKKAKKPKKEKKEKVEKVSKKKDKKDELDDLDDLDLSDIDLDDLSDVDGIDLGDDELDLKPKKNKADKKK